MTIPLIIAASYDSPEWADVIAAWLAFAASFFGFIISLAIALALGRKIITGPLAQQNKEIIDELTVLRANQRAIGECLDLHLPDRVEDLPKHD